MNELTEESISKAIREHRLWVKNHYGDGMSDRRSDWVFYVRPDCKQKAVKTRKKTLLVEPTF